MAANLSRSDAEAYLGAFLRSKAVKSYPRIMDGYVKSPGFTRLLRGVLRDGGIKDQSAEEATEGDPF